MAIFRDYRNDSRDRATEDRRRHHELVEDAIKKNIGDIIAEESIIGQNKDKIIKIPIKGVKEYSFVYGKNQKQAGSGEGNEKRGQRVGKANQQQKGEGGQGAGNEPGEDIYETEVTIEQLVHYLFEDLELPFLERKRYSQLEAEKNFKRSGIKRKGIPPRLAKRRSVMEKIKRKKAMSRSEDSEELENQRFPFSDDDLRYYRVKEEIRKESNAVVICIMDVSGSMDRNKKYLARSFYFLLYQFVRLKYRNVDVVFISHTTSAKEVTEDEFFHRGESGGTFISSGYAKALQVIEQRYNPAAWNIYAFHCSDGDNWTEDNQKAVNLAKALCEVCNLFGYGEIRTSPYGGNMRVQYLNQIKGDNFSIVKINKKEDVWPAFKKMLEQEEK